MVAGRASPRMANSELDDSSDEIFTALFEAVSVACRLALDPTVTFPKERVGGVTPSSGSEGLEPVPRRLMFRGEFGSLLASVRVPLAYPSAVGVKMTGSSMLAPGWRFTGKVNLPNEKALPCSFLEVIRNVSFPVLESWME